MIGRTPTRTHQCRSCHGRGEVHFSPSHEDRPCTPCKGTGYITEAEYQEWNSAGLDREVAKRLRNRAQQAFEERDDSLASLLRYASERLEKR
jgi:DnaJ-class molecular chaperone